MTEQTQERKQQTRKYEKQMQQKKQQDQNLQEKTATKSAMQKYVVTWQSTTNQELGCKTPDFKYGRIPGSKYDGKYRLEAVVEASSIKSLEETLKSCFPDCEDLKYKPYKPGKHIQICQRLAIAIDYTPGNA